MRHFSVKNFEKFQHYKSSTTAPAWIKLYAAVRVDPDFLNLPDASKAHLMLIWLLASQVGNRVRLDAKYVGIAIGASEKVDLDNLVEAGFLIVEDERKSSGPLDPPSNGSRESLEQLGGEPSETLESRETLERFEEFPSLSPSSGLDQESSENKKTQDQEGSGGFALSALNGKPARPPPPSKKAPAKNLETSWPEDFILTAEMREYALARGIADPDREFSDFRDWAESKGATYVSWPAGWRTRCNRADRFAGSKPTNGNRNGSSGYRVPPDAPRPPPLTTGETKHEH